MKMKKKRYQCIECGHVQEVGGVYYNYCFGNEDPICEECGDSMELIEDIFDTEPGEQYESDYY